MFDVNLWFISEDKKLRLPAVKPFKILARQRTTCIRDVVYDVVNIPPPIIRVDCQMQTVLSPSSYPICQDPDWNG